MDMFNIYFLNYNISENIYYLELDEFCKIPRHTRHINHSTYFLQDVILEVRLNNLK